MNDKEFISLWFDCKVNNQIIRKRYYGHLCADDDAIYSYDRHFPLARPCENGFLLNGDRYSSITSSYQSLTRSVCTETCKNGNLKFAVIPFTVLNNAGLIPWGIIEIVDKIDEQYRDFEYMDRHGKKKVRREHLLGGSLIKHGNRHLLSSNDPSATWSNGYFLTELIEPAGTVEQALESLKPELVRQLEGDLGHTEKLPDSILRQGDWFFVKMDQREFVRLIKFCKRITNIEKNAIRNGYLPSGDSSMPHHRVTRLIPVDNDQDNYFTDDEKRLTGNQLMPGFYCCGTVRHDNTEHRMLKLGNGREWYIALRNRQVCSWSYDGGVD